MHITISKTPKKRWKGPSQYNYGLVGFKKFQTSVIIDESNLKCFIEKMTNQVNDITTVMSVHCQFEVILVFVLKKKKDNFKNYFT